MTGRRWYFGTIGVHFEMFRHPDRALYFFEASDV